MGKKTFMKKYWDIVDFFLHFITIYSISIIAMVFTAAAGEHTALATATDWTFIVTIIIISAVLKFLEYMLEP